MSHIWMGHVTHMNESCHTYERVMSHILWVMSHIWMSHVTHMNGSCLTYEWAMPHVWMSPSCVGHESFVCGTWVIRMWDMTHPMSNTTFEIWIWFDVTHILLTWLVRVWDMTHSNMRHDSSMTRLLRCEWVMSYLFSVGPDSSMCGTWLVCMWDMTHLYMGHDSYVTRMSHVTLVWDMTRPFVGLTPRLLFYVYLSHVSRVVAFCVHMDTNNI